MPVVLVPCLKYLIPPLQIGQWADAATPRPVRSHAEDQSNTQTGFGTNHRPNNSLPGIESTRGLTTSRTIVGRELERRLTRTNRGDGDYSRHPEREEGDASAPEGLEHVLGHHRAVLPAVPVPLQRLHAVRADKPHPARSGSPAAGGGAGALGAGGDRVVEKGTRLRRGWRVVGWQRWFRERREGDC